jgi:hypothetical protein
MQGFKPSDAPEDWTGRDWDEIRSALKPLLNHSDCDGYLHGYECEEVLPRLRVIVAAWDPADYDTKQAAALIEGMEHCIEHGCAMQFC